MVFNIWDCFMIWNFLLLVNKKYVLIFLLFLKLFIVNYSVVFFCLKKFCFYKRKCERCRSYKGFILIFLFCLSVIFLLFILFINFFWRFFFVLCMEYVGFIIFIDIYLFVVVFFLELLNIFFVLLLIFKRYFYFL